MIGCSITEEEFPKSPDSPSESFGETVSDNEEDEIYTEKYNNPKEIYVVKEIIGKRKGLLIEEDDRYKCSDVDNTLYSLFYKNGEPVFDMAVEDYYFYEIENETDECEYYINVCKSGKLFIYKLTDEKYELFEKYAPEEKEIFGYTVFNYYWTTGKMSYGVKYENTIIIEPIYSRVILPFEDRAILWEGSVDGGGESRNTLVNLSGEKCCEYNTIWFYNFDDGSYIGIAISYGEKAYTKCYDENGDERWSGFWFIDKDGNRISPRFEQIWVNRSASGSIESPDDIITATDEKGNLLEFTARDYICKE